MAEYIGPPTCVLEAKRRSWRCRMSFWQSFALTCLAGFVSGWLVGMLRDALERGRRR